MQLLPPQQIQSKTNAEEALRISRIKELREAEEASRISLAKADLEFQNTLVKNQEEWEREYEEHQERVRAMKKEIEKLTAERISAAIPFNILKEGVEARMKDAEQILEGVKKREQDAQDLTERLEEKLSEVEEREEDMKIREQKVRLEESDARKRIADAQEAQEKLAIAVLQFNKDSEKKSNELKDLETKLTLKSSSLDSREDGIKGREREIENKEKRISDERAVLDRAWQELKRKKP